MTRLRGQGAKVNVQRGRHLRCNHILDFGRAVQVFSTRGVVVDPAFDVSERPVRGALEEIDPHISRTQLQRDPQPRSRLFRVPEEISSRSASRFVIETYQ